MSHSTLDPEPNGHVLAGKTSSHRGGIVVLNQEVALAVVIDFDNGSVEGVAGNTVVVDPDRVVVAVAANGR